MQKGVVELKDRENSGFDKKYTILNNKLNAKVNLWSLLTYVYVLILLVILPFSRSFEK
jgi:hypothetical protein